LITHVKADAPVEKYQNKSCFMYTCLWHDISSFLINGGCMFYKNNLLTEAPALSSFEITADGELLIVDTGGSSASEGGMGSGSKDKEEKGDIGNPKRDSTYSDKEETEEKNDPVGKEIKKAERESDGKR
jgi:hypothetical protein